MGGNTINTNVEGETMEFEVVPMSGRHEVSRQCRLVLAGVPGTGGERRQRGRRGGVARLRRRVRALRALCFRLGGVDDGRFGG